FFSSRRRHTRWPRDWSSDVCSSDLGATGATGPVGPQGPNGIGLVTGAYLYLPSGTAAPAGFTKIGTSQVTYRDLSGKNQSSAVRSEERRVGKESRSRRGTYHGRKQM